jgi:hypothetical protein
MVSATIADTNLRCSPTCGKPRRDSTRCILPHCTDVPDGTRVAP